MTTLAETAASTNSASIAGRQNAACGGWVDGQWRHEHALLDPSPYDNSGNKYLVFDYSREGDRWWKKAEDGQRETWRGICSVQVVRWKKTRGEKSI